MSQVFAIPLRPAELVEYPSMPAGPELRVVGLFAGIGGVELGLHKRSPFQLLCEWDAAAQRVLATASPR